MPKPIIFAWDGEVMLPISSAMAKLCDATFVVGQRYRLIEYEDRSTNSHNHYFAALSTAHDNLSDDLFERFPTVEHLRKYALIKCGYFDSRSIAVKNNSQAKEIARFVKPMDEFSIVAAHEATVTIHTAKSQSRKAMGAKIFQESKSKVLDYVASLIATRRETLVENAGRAA